MMLNKGVSVPLAILIGLTAGFLLGALNGVIINKLGLTPLVATMGTWMAYRGAALVMLGGGTLSSFPRHTLRGDRNVGSAAAGRPQKKMDRKLTI